MNQKKAISAGLVAIVSMIAVYLLWYPAKQQGQLGTDTPASPPVKSPALPATPALAPHKLANDQNYVGSAACSSCHAKEHELWQASHHDQSMQHATKETVKGNFSNQQLTALGQESHFFQRDGKFFVNTPGPEGKPADFEILYTFGNEPLQQYIVGFPNGRLQMLPLAWDTLKQQWFHLQSHQNPQPEEWIYWSNGGMNWNSMCADCHSTNLHKNFDNSKNAYNTTWSVLDVGCESCHGPGKKHLEHAQKGITDAEPANTYLDMTVGEKSTVLVDKCGRCHARRQQLTHAFQHDSDTLLDHYLPETMRQGLYHADGQIEDEVFVYGSFVQSKMYHMGVSCNNCHDPHSVKLKRSGNETCTSCHIADMFDTDKHHHHGKNTLASVESNESIKGTGDRCVDCHMPGKVYMGNDFRRDHSLRIPRPDLSVKYQTPNACNICHQDRSPEWSAKAVENWFGKERPAHFSETLALAANDPDAALHPLINLLGNQSQPAIARATAAQLLAPLSGDPDILAALNQALKDSSPLVRATTANSLYSAPIQIKTAGLLPLLNDPVRAVRIAAAHSLIELPPAQLPTKDREAFAAAQQEYTNSLEMSIDFAFGHHQKALDYEKQGLTDKAQRHYQQSLTIDNHNNASRMNLAHLHYRQQRFREAEQLYRRTLEQEPDAPAPLYALALLLAEQGRLAEAEPFLERSALISGNPRAWYNLAVIRHQQQKPQSAISAYREALVRIPNSMEFLQGLVSLYAQDQQWDKARQAINDALQLDPANAQLRQLQQALENSYQQSLRK